MLTYIQVYCVINSKYKIKKELVYMLDLKHNKPKPAMNGTNRVIIPVIASANDKDFNFLKPYFTEFQDIESRKLPKIILTQSNATKLSQKMAEANIRKAFLNNQQDCDLLSLDAFNSPFNEFSIVVYRDDNSIGGYMDIKYYDTPVFYTDDGPIKYIVSVSPSYSVLPSFRLMMIAGEDSTGNFHMDLLAYHGLPVMSSQNKYYTYNIKASSEHNDMITEITNSVLASVSVVLYAFNVKPEIFIESQEKYKVRDRSSGKKKNVKKHPIKVRKVFRIDDDQLEDFCSKSTHVITCESWEVSGHYRTYKNGKKVWIKPYRKGKKRDEVTPTPNTYIV